MKKLTLYKYPREDGGVSVSLTKPESDIDYVELYRIVAEDGKVLTNGEIEAICIDVTSSEGWYEIDAEEEGQL